MKSTGKASHGGFSLVHGRNLKTTVAKTNC